MSRIRSLFASVVLLGTLSGHNACADSAVQYYGGVGANYGFKATCNAGSPTQTNSFTIPAGFAGDVSIHGSGGDNAALITAAADGAGTLIYQSVAQQNILSPTIVKTGTNQWAIQNCSGNQGTPSTLDVQMTGVILGQMPGLTVSQNHVYVSPTTSSSITLSVVPTIPVPANNWIYSYKYLLGNGANYEWKCTSQNRDAYNNLISCAGWTLFDPWGNQTPASTPQMSVTYPYTIPNLYDAQLVVSYYSSNSSPAASPYTSPLVPITVWWSYPADLHLTGQGCCNTYATFAWTPVPNADGYEVNMDPANGPCWVGASNTVYDGTISSMSVQSPWLCLGSTYNASIRVLRGGQWTDWAAPVQVWLPLYN